MVTSGKQGVTILAKTLNELKHGFEIRVYVL